jgi:septal ring factor EnvC (AmiA/AmiB activator)
MRRRLLIAALLTALAGGGLAVAQPEEPAAANPLELAKRQAQEARRRSELLERQADRATDEAAKARAAAAAFAARIEAAEAEITAAGTRIALIERLRARQRARLAEKQGPLIRLTAALQTMARRPPGLALVRPGSLDEVVHVRALLASTLPEIRARTAEVRAEVERGNALRQQAEGAVAALKAGQEDLRRRKLALAQFEQKQRARSQSLMQSAMFESDRALALGEEARELAALSQRREFQEQVRRRLSALPGPVPRPVNPPQPDRRDRAAYLLPVQGRLLAGMGEISDAGIHARGVTVETGAASEAVAPTGGTIAYAGPFRGYGAIVIIDHGGGLTSTITDLASLAVKRGDRVRIGQTLGRTAARARVRLELRRNGQPVPIAPLIYSG